MPSPAKIAWIGRLAAASVLGVMLLGGVGLFGIFAQHRETARAVASYEHRRQLEATLVDALVQFKIEIQEWKNVLLRGQGADAFLKWKSTYTQQAGKTSKAFDELASLASVADFPQEERELIGRLKQQHSENVALYLETLEKNYRPDDPSSIFVVDAMVRGKDRTLGADLDSFADRVGTREVAKLEAALKDGEIRYERYKTINVVIMLIVGVLTLALAILTTHLGRSLAAGTDLTNG